MTTLREAIRSLAGAFRAAGLDSPDVDARILAGAASGMTAREMLVEPDRVLGDDQISRLLSFRKRRLAREPVSRILGRRDFYGRSFAIDATTLDPRPDTETVIEAALEIADEEGWRARPIRILDVGTGSGCLLLTLIAELPLATGLATDVSDGALRRAAANAESLGVQDRVQFAVNRSLEGLSGPFDLLVSNPPYIPTPEMDSLEHEVKGYDPMPALDGGADGLDIYRELARDLVRVVPEGWAVLEVGAGQADAVRGLLAASAGRSAKAFRIRSDLGGHERSVAVQTHKVLMTH